MKRIYFTILLLLSAVLVFGSDITKTTYVYDVKDNDTLRLDRYELGTVTQKKPCVIFVFGGGFVGGTRDRSRYLDYFNHLAESGYVVVSIDYRLGLKATALDFKEGRKVGAREIVKRLKNAIDMAVVDLYGATNFVLKNAEEWGVDPNKIVINGSSAGAVTALQAEYYLHSNGNDLHKTLPPKFDYAGVISFAGAIFSTSGNLKWTSNPAPIQFFHGDADRNVPYNKAKIFSVGFFGSKTLVDQLSKTKSPYQFIDFFNADHAIAEYPMGHNFQDIVNFITEWTINNRKVEEHVVVKDLTLPDVKKKFGIKDYIRSNFE